MGGTSETAFWEQDGMYLTMTAGEAITLGQVVAIGSTDGYAVIAGTTSTHPIGVAIAGYRTSRTATDSAVASGSLVTVATRGVVNVTCTGTVTRGDLVCTETAGQVLALSNTGAVTQYKDVAAIVGKALTTGTTTTIKVKLMLG